MRKITLCLALLAGTVLSFTSCSTENLAVKNNYNKLGIAQQSPPAGTAAVTADRMPAAQNVEAPTFVASTEKVIAAPTLKKAETNFNAPETKTTNRLASIFKKGIGNHQHAFTSPLNKKHMKAGTSAKGGDKNWIVAMLLCFFLGELGIHRFYLGYTGIGLIQLGMFLIGLVLSPFIIGIPILLALWIWVLVDFIRIIIKSLEPKNGSYS